MPSKSLSLRLHHYYIFLSIFIFIAFLILWPIPIFSQGGGNREVRFVEVTTDSNRVIEGKRANFPYPVVSPVLCCNQDL